MGKNICVISLFTLFFIGFGLLNKFGISSLDDLGITYFFEKLGMKSLTTVYLGPPCPNYWIALVFVTISAFLNKNLFTSQLSWLQILTVIIVMVLIVAYSFTLHYEDKALYQAASEVLFNLGLFFAANAAVNIKQ